jgi:hypothetical protein
MQQNGEMPSLRDPILLAEAVEQGRLAVAQMGEDPVDSPERRERWIAAQLHFGTVLRNQASSVRLGAARLIQPGAGRLEIEAAAASQRELGNPVAAGQLFGEAAGAFRSAAAAMDPRQEMARWTETMRRQGELLAEQAVCEGESGMAVRLEEAMAIYRIALRGCCGKAEPLVWARTQMSLAVAWQWWSQCGDGDDVDERNDAILAAVECYREAMAVCTSEKHERDRFTALGNLGGLLTELGMLDSGQNRRTILEEAQGCLEEWVAHPLYERWGDPSGRAKLEQRKLRRLLRWAV